MSSLALRILLRYLAWRLRQLEQAAWVERQVIAHAGREQARLAEQARTLRRRIARLGRPPC